MNLIAKFCLVAILTAAVSPLLSTPLTPNPDLTTQGVGLAVIQAGIGLEDLGAGIATLPVMIGGPVSKAFFYWAGRDRPCPIVDDVCVVPAAPSPYKDQELLFDGIPITGVIVGTENQFPPSDLNNIAYRADVTSIVQAEGTGAVSFEIADGNVGNDLFRLNGGTLVVLYTDPTDPQSYAVTVFEGMDFALGRGDQQPAAQVTEPVVFMYPVDAASRTAELGLSAGDATDDRGDQVDISDNASLVDTLVSSDGVSWDSPVVPITLPAGSGSTTVQLLSVPFQPDPNEDSPDSLLWILGSLRVPFTPETQSCRLTGGGNNETLAANSDNRYTLGGQVGAPVSSPPQPRGHWTHHQQTGTDGRFVFHAGTSSAPEGTEIDAISCSDPNNCVPARNAPFKQLDFQGVGTFANMDSATMDAAGVVAGETRHWFEVHTEDLGEPGAANAAKKNAGGNCPPTGSAGTLADCRCPDFYRIRIFAPFDHTTEAPNKTNVIYEVYGYTDGGNLQIHPPTGREAKNN